MNDQVVLFHQALKALVKLSKCVFFYADNIVKKHIDYLYSDSYNSVYLLNVPVNFQFMSQLCVSTFVRLSFL